MKTNFSGTDSKVQSWILQFTYCLTVCSVLLLQCFLFECKKQFVATVTQSVR